MSFSPVAANVSSQPSPADVSFITELYDVIEESPTSVEARKLLVQQLIACDWLEAAWDAASGLLAIVPHDREAQDWLNVIQNRAEAKREPEDPFKSKPVQIEDIGDVKKADSQPPGGYKNMFTDFLDKFRKQKQQGGHDSQPISSLLVGDAGEGSIAPSKQMYSKPENARKVVRQMVKSPLTAVDIAFQDLKDMAYWLRSTSKQSPAAVPVAAASQEMTVDNDAIREALQKRTQALISVLPVNLQQAPLIAQMHIEHEILYRTYICTETMYGDQVSEIPRERFWVTEDGYPWDMEELAQAITSNGGVMRNPLSRQLFTPKDVKAIVQHPLGRALAALQLTQSELTKGVRPRTIEELAKLSTVMLGDDSADQLESRHALDEFLAYIATLPEEEQKALDKLRVPARDSHTGQQYDSSIGDAVEDARGNRVCIHKIGDFLDQAANYLRLKN